MFQLIFLKLFLIYMSPIETHSFCFFLYLRTNNGDGIRKENFYKYTTMLIKTKNLQ